MPAPKPETMSQAQTWQRVCQLAENAGLCPRCASQFAWGVQGGFATVKDPCAACSVVMLAWPVVRPNGWRSPQGKLSLASSWLASRLTGRTPPPASDPVEV